MKIELGNFRFELDYIPGTRGVRYHPDGSGTPPTGPELVVNEVWHDQGESRQAQQWVRLDDLLAQDIADLVYNELLERVEETLLEEAERDE